MVLAGCKNGFSRVNSDKTNATGALLRIDKVGSNARRSEHRAVRAVDSGCH